ncbi:MAG: hypothetical protein LT105_15550 [Lentimicrobium sp.]|jgi:hypothetical protein|nr:hypothetical protein [Lentimicrobium sp.]
MASFNSNEVSIAKSDGFVYDFLSDFRNFEKLMPEQITNWSSDGESCSFTIQNMATLGMKFRTKTPNSLLDIESDGKSPFPFTLTCNIKAKEADHCITALHLNADLSPMLMMMASRPLSNFVNILAEKLKQVCESM